MLRLTRHMAPVVLAGLVVACLSVAWAQEPSAKPVPRVIEIGTGAQDHVPLLSGPPGSVTMESGVVTLQPGTTVGEHDTEDYEEILLILEGQGAMILDDGRRLEMKAGNAAYCPPDTKHDVQNTGPGPLRYIYVAAKTR